MLSDRPLRVAARVLRDSTRILEGTTGMLDQTIEDIPRLRKVLKTQKIFGVVPECDVKAAKEAVNTEIAPELEQLADLNEKILAKLRRKKTGLQSQAQLLQVRLMSAESLSPQRKERSHLKSGGATRSSEADLARLRFLRNKSDRLDYSLSRRRLQNKQAKLSFTPSLPPAD
ncbi:hypothetical protein HF325_001631 [Metschnikowia pulcherrima]|uniref:DASH complex subunit SPC19 n=1 Tax=Metschnikowia pulcherrima TaxID=27326 RepID=A0A8H7LDU6_9ASCO|nr:hypothetical protein HF325_001631 [Metschnikowia pulcherrima]